MIANCQRQVWYINIALCYRSAKPFPCGALFSMIKLMFFFFLFQWMVVLHPTPTSLLVARPVEVESSRACDPAPTLNHVMVGRTVLETTKRHASAIHSLAQVSLFYEVHKELDLMIQKSGRSKYLGFSLWVGVGYLEKYTNATWTGQQHNCVWICTL